MRVVILLLLVTAVANAQEENDMGLSSAVQVDAGLFGDFFYKQIDASQMQLLTDESLPQWAALTQPKFGDGVYSSINAGYYTFTYRQILPSAKRVWWTAGLSVCQRNFAELFFYSDTVFSVPTTTAGDSIFRKRSYQGSAGLRGFQLNFPFGLRFMHADPGKRYISIGLNVAPGFTFNHKYWDALLVTVSNAIEESGSSNLNFGPPVTDFQSFIARRTPGMFFTAYAGIPVQFNFNPYKRWQFAVNFEPGYSLTFLKKVSQQGSVMMRLGIGVKYLLK